MTVPWDQPWSNSTTAPNITKYSYTVEKVTLAGSLIGSILYGLLTLLFFQCMAALFNSAHRRAEGIKWWPVFYTMAMFSFVTVYTAASLHILSMSFIDNREDNTNVSSGPLNYQFNIRHTPLSILPNVMFNLNNWLADGFLIYRCYIIYSTNLWAIALPCLLYLASLGTGIVTLYFQSSGHGPVSLLGLSGFGIAYLSVSVSLNVLLTLMIVIRLILHARNVRIATGSLAGISRLHKTVSTMFIESCALFTVSSMLVVGALAAFIYSDTPNVYLVGRAIVSVFFPVLAEVQVIAPLLIIQRVANGSALTSHAVTAGYTSLFDVRGEGEPMGRDGTPLSSRPKNLAAGYGNNPGEPRVAVGRTADLRPGGAA